MMVASEASDSANFVTAKCRRSWKRNPRKGVAARLQAAIPARALAGSDHLLSGLSTGPTAGFLHQCPPRGTPCLLRPGGIVSSAVPWRLAPVFEPRQHVVLRSIRAERAGTLNQSGEGPHGACVEGDFPYSRCVPLDLLTDTSRPIMSMSLMCRFLISTPRVVVFATTIAA